VLTIHPASPSGDPAEESPPAAPGESEGSVTGIAAVPGGSEEVVTGAAHGSDGSVRLWLDRPHSRLVVSWP
jgi:hypothetical protein